VSKRTGFALIALYLLIYILPLGVRPPQRPDELRYAEIPREMLESGDWIVPHLNGLRYFEKPPLGYWITAASLRVFGENNFAMRLPSALATGIIALLLLLFIKRHFANPRLTWFGPAIFLTLAQVFTLGVTNILDSVLACMLTATMLAFYEAQHTTNRSHRRIWLAVFGVACGLAFLTKGFLAFVLPPIAILPFLLWTRRGKDLLSDAWIVLIALGLVVLPWSIAIQIREPDFWPTFFWMENVRRFVSPKAEHAKPLYFFLLELLKGAIPWTFLLPAAVLGARKLTFAPTALRFTLCWFVFPFVFFSVGHGKLATYIQPCFPPLAILIAFGLERYLASERRLAFDLGAGLLAGIIGLGTIALGVIQFTQFGPRPVFAPSELGWYALLSATLVVWVLCLLIAICTSRAAKKFLFFALGPLALFVSIQPLSKIDILPLTSSEAFFVRGAERTPKSSPLVVHGELIRSVNWYFKRTDAYMFENVDELGYGIHYDEASESRFIPDFDALATFIADRPRTDQIVTVIMETDVYEDGQFELPEPIAIDQTDRLTLVQYRAGSR